MERIGQWLMAKILHRHAISAVVCIGDGVQRLMHVADKVDEVTDRFGALQRIGGLILQNGALLFDGARHASFGAAELRQIALVFAARNIDVMPWTVLALVA